MMHRFQHIVHTVQELVKHDQYKLAHGILNHYYTKCVSLEDYDLVGGVALKSQHAQLATQAAERALSLSETPEQAYVARVNLNKAYYQLNDPERALFYVNLNLDMTPEDFDLQVAKAAALKLNNQRTDSEELINQIKHSNITPEQREGLKITDTHPLLRQGKVADGIYWFLHNPEKDKTTVFDLRGMKRWDGIIRPGSKLYVNAEGGAGDEFINIRFFHHLRDLGMEPILFTNLDRTDLMQVWERNGYTCLSDTDLIDPHTPWTYLLWLPIHLRLSEADLWRAPYVTPKHDAAHDLGPHNKFRVGIKCTGNPYFQQDRFRQIPLEHMLSVIPQDSEVYLFDLDQTHAACVNLGPQIKSWEHTLDYIDQMDVILGSCTSVIHASGSMGKPTIACVPILEYYVWTSTHGAHSTPWYADHMHVCKQQKVNCWQQPLRNAGKIIAQYKQQFERRLS